MRELKRRLPRLVVALEVNWQHEDAGKIQLLGKESKLLLATDCGHGDLKHAASP